MFELEFTSVMLTTDAYAPTALAVAPVVLISLATRKPPSLAIQTSDRKSTRLNSSH